jgi:hypothetical protein
MENTLSQSGNTTGKPVTSKPAARAKTASSSAPKSTGSRKRKAPIKDEDEDDKSASSVPQADGSGEDKSTKRQTRGKKLSLDFSAMVKANDSSSSSDDYDSDGEFILGSNPSKAPTVVKQVDDLPIAKRARVASAKPQSKKAQPKLNSLAAQKFTSSKAPAAKTITMGPPTKTDGTKISSIIKAPSAAPLSQSSIAYNQMPKLTDASDDDGLEIFKRLRPGSLVNVRALEKARAGKKDVTKPTPQPAPATEPAAESPLSSSHDSADKMLQQNLVDHLFQQEIRPEDSISNFYSEASHSQANTNNPPATPTSGKTFPPSGSLGLIC